jgi:hypothetical protein
MAETMGMIMMARITPAVAKSRPEVKSAKSGTEPSAFEIGFHACLVRNGTRTNTPQSP